MLTGGRERTGEGNIDWRNGADWRAECLLEEKTACRRECNLKEESGLERVMLAGRSKRSGEWDIEWRNGAD